MEWWAAIESRHIFSLHLLLLSRRSTCRFQAFPCGGSSILWVGLSEITLLTIAHLLNRFIQMLWIESAWISCLVILSLILMRGLSSLLLTIRCISYDVNALMVYFLVCNVDLIRFNMDPPLTLLFLSWLIFNQYATTKSLQTLFSLIQHHHHWISHAYSIGDSNITLPSRCSCKRCKCVGTVKTTATL